MIITVQGYNGKKNLSTYTIAALAGMSALTTNNKHLVIQLVDYDIDSVESFYTDMSYSRRGYEQKLNDKGIDSILANTFQGTKLVKNDFAYYTTSLFPKNENRLDILEISQSPYFINTFNARKEELKLLLASANEVYDYVYVLLPSLVSTYMMQLKGETANQLKNQVAIQSTIDEINEELAEYSVYCLAQGHTLKQEHIRGNNIVYLIPQYDEESLFNLKSVRKKIAKKGDKVCKIAYSRKAMDAVLTGTFINFIKANKKNDIYDSNYIWMRDIKSILEGFYGIGDIDSIKAEEWDKLEEKSSIALVSTDLFPEPMVADPDITGRKFLFFNLKDKKAPEKQGVVFTLNDLTLDESANNMIGESENKLIEDSDIENAVEDSYMNIEQTEESEKEPADDEEREESITPAKEENEQHQDVKKAYQKIEDEKDSAENISIPEQEAHEEIEQEEMINEDFKEASEAENENTIEETSSDEFFQYLFNQGEQILNEDPLPIEDVLAEIEAEQDSKIENVQEEQLIQEDTYEDIVEEDFDYDNHEEIDSETEKEVIEVFDKKEEKENSNTTAHSEMSIAELESQMLQITKMMEMMQENIKKVVKSQDNNINTEKV